MIASILLQAGPNGAHGTGHGTGAFLWLPLLVLVRTPPCTTRGASAGLRLVEQALVDWPGGVTIGW